MSRWQLVKNNVAIGEVFDDGQAEIDTTDVKQHLVSIPEADGFNYLGPSDNGHTE